MLSSTCINVLILDYVLDLWFLVYVVVNWALLTYLYHSHEHLRLLFVRIIAGILAFMWLDLLILGPYLYSETPINYLLDNFWPKMLIAGLVPFILVWVLLSFTVEATRFFKLDYTPSPLLVECVDFPSKFFCATLPLLLLGLFGRYCNGALKNVSYGNTKTNLLTFFTTWFPALVVELSLNLPRFYHLNDLIWQDGFLIDFLQKKMVDKWTRKFLIYSGYLFNERLVFDWAIRFYLDLVIWPTYRVTIYEFTNVASTLLATLFIFLGLYLVLSLGYVGLLLFY